MLRQRREVRQVLRGTGIWRASSRPLLYGACAHGAAGEAPKSSPKLRLKTIRENCSIVGFVSARNPQNPRLNR